MFQNTIYDLAIIGGGPAGVAAGIYASRKRLRTVFLTKDWGGQSLVSPEIQNWIGTVKISGIELGDALRNHLKTYAGDAVDIKEGEEIIKIEKRKAKSEKLEADIFSIATANTTYEAKTVLIATGSKRRKLEVQGASKFEHNGVTYCASCDGPFFADMAVAVIGGGNAGFETAAQLLAYCKSVTLLIRGDNFRADPITVKKVLADPKMRVIQNAEILEITGDKTLSGILYRDKKTGKTEMLSMQGVFAEIGSVPSTEFAKGLAKMTEWNQIIVDPRNQRTSIEGIWAAGDCTDGLYHQNNIAAGDAIKALEDIYLFLRAK